jgi:uncharacterized RDD family membrane protein YckC
MSLAASDSTAMLRISTPEGVTFSLPLAGPVSRAIAALLDYFVVAVILNLVSYVLIFGNMISVDITQGLMMLAQFVLTMGYSAFCELLFQGQTVGKRAVGLRVMDERGLSLRPSQVLVRNLVRLVDQLPAFYAVGGVSCLLSKRCQRLGDLAAGTVVVRRVKTTPPDVESVLGGKYNSFRAHPHLEARLRQKVSPEEAQIALAALVRKDELTVEAGLKVFSSLAERFRAVVKFPEETIIGLSDEQYVRNVVSSLYRV